jgi:CRISPR/Cas system-associated exonuclease Cas4 (RecB family)
MGVKMIKVFKQSPIELPELEQINESTGRKYARKDDPFGITYPSITTILGSQSKDGIEKWRKRVGEAEADKILYQAQVRGTKNHEMVEDYIQNKGLQESTPFELNLFLKLKEIIDQHIDNIHVVEGRMMSDHLRAAGTVDCIAEFNGKLSVIDWKTSRKPKKRDWINNYFMQASAYAVMFEENTGIPIEQLVIAMACETGETQLFVEKRDDWIGKFLELREQYDKNSNA